MTKLQFVGDLGLWVGVAVALAATVLAWRVYRREVTRAGIDPSLKWKLPLLRGLAVFMLMMMLTGPVLMHRKVVGQVARVLVFLDGSKSMTLDDRHMEPGRKLVLVARNGWLPPGKVDVNLIDAADALAEAQRLALEAAGTGAADRVGMKQLAEAAAAKVHEAADKLGEAKLDTVAPPRPGRGSMLWELWNAGGDQRVDEKQVAELTKKPADKSGLVSTFDAPANSGDNYLLRMRGWVYPPTTGEYVFYVSSDDMGVLWLSTDDTAANKKQIAMNPNAAGRGNWPEGTAKSGGVKLEAGRAYYIEAIVKEASGDDYLAIGWRMPDGKMERPIAGEHVAPLASPNDRDAASGGGDLLAQMRTELVEPADKAADAGLGAADAAELDRVRGALREVAAAAGRFEQSLRSDMDRAAEQLLAADDAAVKAAFDRFDATSRWDRAQHMLLDGDEPGLARIAKHHDVELLSLDGQTAQRLWTPTADNKIPSKLAVEPRGVTSNLSGGVREKMIGSRDGSAASAEATAAELPGAEEQRTAAVLITDGRHNDGEAPLALARVLGDRRMPVYTISMGSGVDPRDLAVLGVEGPQTIYQDDRVAGRVLIADHMEPGKAFTLRIEHEGKTVWSKQLSTAGVAQRYIDYDFPIRELVDAKVKDIKGGDKDLTVNALPLALTAVIDPVDGEQRPDNNRAPLNVQASTQRRRMLLVDSRPRWETRYIRNLFERDERWQVNTVLVGPATERDTLRKGDKAGDWPTDRESLYAYDLVILGEVPAGAFDEEQLESLRLFVSERGGGLVLLDGTHGLMRTLATGPLGDALPVEWEAESEPAKAAMAMPQRLELTEMGTATAALTILSDASENDRFWRVAPAPKQVVRIKPLPGAEVLVDAVREQERTPVFVYRRFGAGQVLYSADDEMWRWRYNVADLYHQRLWHQLANWIMEQPYAIADKYVSLDAGGPVYRPGDRARVRVRLRDAEGKPILHATVQAVLWQGEKRMSTVTLDAEQTTGGAFRGLTEPLGDGDWRVTVEVTGFAEDQIKAQTTFKVSPPDTGEMALLTANEPMLRQMADESGGRFLREEDAGKLAGLLEPLSAGRIEESETALWQSYWWFLPMIGALGLEWWLRKRAGMI